MPPITLAVVSMDSAPLPVPLSCRFDGDGGTIGRDEGNTFVLPDKHRRVSRLHAAMAFPSGVPTLTNASTSLPIRVGEVQLDCGRARPLADGDELEIGPYILRVKGTVATGLNVQQSALPAASPSPPVLAAIPAVDSGDPFADLFSEIGSATPAASAPTGPRIELGGASFSSLHQHVAPTTPPPHSVEPVNDPLAGFASAGEQAAGQRFGEVAGVSKDPLAALGLGADVGTPAYSPNVAPARVLSGSIIPEDFNPFDMPSGTARNTADPLSSMLGDGVAQPGVAGNQEAPSIDSLFTSGGPATFDGILNQPSGVPSSQQGLDLLLSTPTDSDPFAMFGDHSPNADSLMQPVRNDLAEVGGAYQPPRAVEANFQARPWVDQYTPMTKVPTQLPSAPACGTDALTQAFLSGAQLPLSVIPGGLTPEIMTLVGSVLRSATAGAVDMLAARAATKLEVQANVTIISSQGNNPLKFLPNGEGALMQLLSKKMPGFMRADEAMKDAFDDLRAHEVGVIAGTRAALAEVLGRFDPAILEQRLSAGSFFESFLPSIRKTKLWDIYVERYAQIRREAEDDFQSIFGRAFVQAYERETARMKVRATEAGGAR